MTVTVKVEILRFRLRVDNRLRGLQFKISGLVLGLMV